MINLYIIIIIPILLATINYLFSKNNFKQITLVLQIILFIITVNNFIFVKNYGTQIENLGGWDNYIGITLRADLLASVFVMLTVFLFLCMYIFSIHKKYTNKLFTFLFLILQSLIIGIFLSNDLFNIYVLIEVSTIVISILIMFKKDGRAIYDGLVYLLVNIVAMTFFLFGIAFLYRTFGILDMSGIQEKMIRIKQPKSLIIPYAMMMTGIGLKSAIMPLFSWLPKAHGTPSVPSIISAILSGLYVKSGVYLFIRLQGMYKGVIDGADYFLVLGFLTGVIGFILALAQTDIKLILSYHTVSQIGLIMIGLNYPEGNAYWGGIYHIVNHAFFKSTLFLCAGIIIDEYKTRNLWKIRGVFQRMPCVGIASLLAILGITGAPLFNGSISKYLIQSSAKGTILDYGLLLINLGTIVSFIKFSSMLFGKSGKKTKIKFNQQFVIIILGLICFIGGILGSQFIQALFNYQISIDVESYFQKAFIYIISLIVGLGLYKVIIKSQIFHKIKEMEFSFNEVCLSIAIFFAVTVLYLGVCMHIC